MNKSSKSHTIRVPDPFDESAKTRLIHMGILHIDGQINQESIPVFADIFTGLFFDDLSFFIADVKDLQTVCNLFLELYEKKEYQHMYLLLSMQYDYIRKPLPDPVWWLAGNSDTVREFMVLFIERLKTRMNAAGIVAPAKGGDRQ